MKTTDWDAVVASAPLDRMAALAAAVGFAGDEEIMLAKARADIRALVAKDPLFVNMIGHVKGRLTVVAYAGGSNGKSGGARWVVRCVCGAYEINRTRVLKPDVAHDRCRACRQVERLRSVNSGVIIRAKAVSA